VEYFGRRGASGMGSDFASPAQFLPRSGLPSEHAPLDRGLPLQLSVVPRAILRR
jgi:hypothetical protein